MRRANWAIYQKRSLGGIMEHPYKVLVIKTEKKRYSVERKGAMEEQILCVALK